MGMSKLIFSILFLLIGLSANSQTVVGQGGWRIVANTILRESKTNSTTAEQDYTTLYTIPANTLVAGKMYRVTLAFQRATGVTTATLLPYAELGGIKIMTGIATDYVNSQTGSHSYEFVVYGTAAAGASVDVITGLQANILAPGYTNRTVQPVALATNGALDITTGVQWSATGSTETMELMSFLIEESY